MFFLLITDNQQILDELIFIFNFATLNF